jgi:hypothetical protein
MSPLYTKDGKLLISNGALATSSGCCCGRPNYGCCCYCPQQTTESLNPDNTQPYSASYEINIAIDNDTCVNLYTLSPPEILPPCWDPESPSFNQWLTDHNYTCPINQFNQFDTGSEIFQEYCQSLGGTYYPANEPGCTVSYIGYCGEEMYIEQGNQTCPDGWFDQTFQAEGVTICTQVLLWSSSTSWNGGEHYGTCPDRSVFGPGWQIAVPPYNRVTGYRSEFYGGLIRFFLGGGLCQAKNDPFFNGIDWSHLYPTL